MKFTGNPDVTITEGLVPKFLRPSDRRSSPPDAIDGSARPQGSDRPAARSPDGHESERPAAGPRRGAYEPTAEEMRKNHRRIHALASPESIAARRKLADAIGLAGVCSSAACQRAKSCQGIGGAVCLLDHRDIVQPVLRVLNNAPLPETDA